MRLCINNKKINKFFVKSIKTVLTRIYGVLSHNTHRSSSQRRTQFSEPAMYAREPATQYNRVDPLAPLLFSLIFQYPEYRGSPPPHPRALPIKPLPRLDPRMQKEQNRAARKEARDRPHTHTHHVRIVCIMYIKGAAFGAENREKIALRR